MKNKNQKEIDMIVGLLEEWSEEKFLGCVQTLKGETKETKKLILGDEQFKNVSEAILSKLQRNQVVIAEGRFIISNGKEFGISQRACYIKLSPRKLIGIGALGRRLEEKGVEGKKVLIILEEVDEN